MTDIWGPPFWESLHYVSFAYPLQAQTDDIRKYFAFFNSIADVLPCPICRDHLKAHMKKHPIEYALQAGREGLVRWVIDIHNEVNKSLQKPVLTYDEVIEIYTNKMRLNEPIATLTPQNSSADSSSAQFPHMDFILIGAILAASGYLLYRASR